MAHLKNRQPDFFRDRSSARGTGARFDRLSKADWADVFCDLWLAVHGEDKVDPEAMMRDAEERTRLLKLARTYAEVEHHADEARLDEELRAHEESLPPLDDEGAL